MTRIFVLNILDKEWLYEVVMCFYMNVLINNTALVGWVMVMGDDDDDDDDDILRYDSWGCRRWLTEFPPRHFVQLTRRAVVHGHLGRSRDKRHSWGIDDLVHRCCFFQSEYDELFIVSRIQGDWPCYHQYM